MTAHLRARTAHARGQGRRAHGGAGSLCDPRRAGRKHKLRPRNTRHPPLFSAHPIVTELLPPELPPSVLCLAVLNKIASARSSVPRLPSLGPRLLRHGRLSAGATAPYAPPPLPDKRTTNWWLTTALGATVHFQAVGRALKRLETEVSISCYSATRLQAPEVLWINPEEPPLAMPAAGEPQWGNT